jgi:hypothetical protein
MIYELLIRYWLQLPLASIAVGFNCRWLQLPLALANGMGITSFSGL